MENQDLFPIYLNTLRVLAEGESQPGDSELLPTDLFSNVTEFISFVEEALEKSYEDPSILNALLKYCITIDTNIGHRFVDDLGDLSDDESVVLLAYQQMDETFSISENLAVASTLDGTILYDGAGMTGTILKVYQELYSQDNYRLFSSLVDLHRTMCRENPSYVECWWLDALRSIYTYESAPDDAPEDFVTVDDSVTDTIESWMIKAINPMHEFWDNYSEVEEDFSENDIIYNLYISLALELNGIEEEFYHKAQEGFVSDSSRRLSSGSRKTVTIEQLFFNLLSDEE